MGEIEEMLAGVGDRRERARIKAGQLAKLAGETFAFGAFAISIVAGPRAVTVNGEPVLEVMVTVSRNARAIKVDGHLRFVNPPVRVWDGTYSTITDPVSGEQIRRKNFVENPRAALRQMIGDAIKAQLR